MAAGIGLDVAAAQRPGANTFAQLDILGLGEYFMVDESQVEAIQ